MKQPTELLDRLLAKQGDLDVSANELLSLFLRGYPLDSLRHLLRNKDPDIVKIGSWMASELGVRARVVLDDVAPLLRHPTPYVRFFAIDSILSCADAMDGEHIAATVRLIDDPDSGVRWKATQFLIQASTAQLGAALGHVEGDGLHATGLRHVLDPFLRSEKLFSLLESAHPTLRRFALAAAARIVAGDEQPLNAAINSGDNEIRLWATEELERRKRDVAI